MRNSIITFCALVAFYPVSAYSATCVITNPNFIQGAASVADDVDANFLSANDCINANTVSIDANTALSHAESHTVSSHSDTTATGAELETLTDASNADSLHVHTGASVSGLVDADITLTTPDLGIPSSADLTNATNLPITGIQTTNEAALELLAGGIDIVVSTETYSRTVDPSAPVNGTDPCNLAGDSWFDTVSGIEYTAQSCTPSVWVNPPGSGTTVTIASSTTTVNPASIASGACSDVTDTATGAATTDVFSFTPATDLTAVTGYAPITAGGVQIFPFITTDTVHFKVCNPTADPIDPSTADFNWIIVR